LYLFLLPYCYGFYGWNLWLVNLKQN